MGAPDPLLKGLEVYIVGGAVRDALLGLPAGDRDWVVVGATPHEMARRGFIPVGGDFPVFLHPSTKEEYALARTERKSGRGYKGFTFYTGPEVTLEDDLKRRDLTINAIARDMQGGLVDPLGGQHDVQERVLRHVGQAFVEDPLRLLRLARFAARFSDFRVAPETMVLARRLVDGGEVDALVPERVWMEVAKGLSTDDPGRMFEILDATGALPRVMPGLVYKPRLRAQLAAAARAGLDIAARFGVLCHLSPAPQEVGRHMRAPGECQDFARLLPTLLAGLAAIQTKPSRTEKPLLWLELMEQCDALRKPDRFMALVAAAACVTEADIDVPAWEDRVSAIRDVDAGAIARPLGGQPELIKAALRDARLKALSSPLTTDGDDRRE